MIFRGERRYLVALVLAILITCPRSALASAGATQPTAALSEDLAWRIGTREFPSIFQAWSPADNLKGEDPWTTLARHDLMFHDARFFGLRWNNPFAGVADHFLSEQLPAARSIRQKLLAKNPHLVILAEIRYRDADPKYLPEDSPWWRRKGGKPVMGWAEGGYVQLDFSNAGFRDQVALQAQAVMQSGIFDGVMLDWWQDDDDRVALIKTVRDAIGSSALILVNSNQHTTPRSAEFVNGYYMECTNSQTAADWQQIGDTLGWAETHLRSPHINCVETWFHHSRQDLNLMRATTTLSLTLSAGYCLFCDPDPLPTPDHLHDWYDFWTRRLGRPIANGEIEPDGTHRRTFTHGTAVYNPMGNAAAVVTFAQTRTRVSSGESGIRFIVPPCDGDVFIQPEAK